MPSNLKPVLCSPLVSCLAIALAIGIAGGVKQVRHPWAPSSDVASAHPEECPPNSATLRFCDGFIHWGYMGEPSWQARNGSRLYTEGQAHAMALRYANSPNEVTVYLNLWSGQSPEEKALEEWPKFGTVKSVAQATAKGRYSVVLAKDPKWNVVEVAQVNR